MRNFDFFVFHERSKITIIVERLKKYILLTYLYIAVDILRLFDYNTTQIKIFIHKRSHHEKTCERNHRRTPSGTF